jgi:hypothetical protein
MQQVARLGDVSRSLAGSYNVPGRQLLKVEFVPGALTLVSLHVACISDRQQVQVSLPYTAQTVIAANPALCVAQSFHMDLNCFNPIETHRTSPLT